MASSNGDPNRGLRRGILGYKRDDVENLVVEHEEKIRELRKEIDTLWIAFAEHDRAVRESLEASGAPAPRVAPWAQRRERANARMARASEMRTGISSPAQDSSSEEDEPVEDGTTEAGASTPEGATAAETATAQERPESPPPAPQPSPTQPQAEPARPAPPKSPQAAASRPPLGAPAEGEPKPGGPRLPKRAQPAAQTTQTQPNGEVGPTQADLEAAAREANQRREALTADLADLEAAMKAIETATRALERNAQQNTES